MITNKNIKERKKWGQIITCYSIQEAKMRLRILLAEDNVVNQRPATELLQGRGHYERYI